jgi:hypothetical protein
MGFRGRRDATIAPRVPTVRAETMLERPAVPTESIRDRFRYSRTRLAATAR